MSTELGKILKMPDTLNRLVAQEHEPSCHPPAQFGEFNKIETGPVGKVVKTVNIKLDH